MKNVKLESCTYLDLQHEGVIFRKYDAGIWMTRRKSKSVLPFENKWSYRFSKPKDFSGYRNVYLLTDTYEILPEPIDKQNHPEFYVIDKVIYHLKDGAAIVCNGSKRKPKFVLITKGAIHE